MSVQVRGLADANRNFQRLLAEVGKATPKGLADMGTHLLEKSVPETPVDTGALRESSEAVVNGQVVATGRKDGGINRMGSPGAGLGHHAQGHVAFGEGLDYAVRQHEDFSYRHPRGGGPKFLENPFRAERPYLLHLAVEAWKEAIDDAI